MLILECIRVTACTSRSMQGKKENRVKTYGIIKHTTGNAISKRTNNVDGSHRHNDE